MIDRLIAALAERQHGVVAVWQLLELGLGRDAIQYRVSIGRLHRIHQRRLRRRAPQAHAARPPDGGRPRLRPRRGPQPQKRRGPLGHRPALVQDRRDDAAQQARAARRSGPTRARLHPEDRTRPTTASRSRASPARSSTSPGSSRKDPLTHLIEEADRKERLDLRALDRAIARRPHAAGIARLKSRARRPTAAPPTRARSSNATSEALIAPRRPARAAVQRPGRRPDSRRVLAAVEARRRTRQRALPHQPERVRDRPHPRRHSPEKRHPRAARHRRSPRQRAGGRARRHPRAQAPGVLDLTSSRSASGSHDRFSGSINRVKSTEALAQCRCRVLPGDQGDLRSAPRDDMIRRDRMTRLWRALAFLAAAGAALVLSTSAFAVGAGSSQPQVQWKTSLGPATWSGKLTALYPGASRDTELLPITVINTGRSAQRLSSVSASIPAGAGGDAQTAAGADIRGCRAAWFSASIGDRRTALARRALPRRLLHRPRGPGHARQRHEPGRLRGRLAGDNGYREVATPALARAP